MGPEIELPTGTVTFLFTDIEGSTRLLQETGEGYRQIQHDHDAIMRRAVADSDGVVIRTEGDSFFAVFRTPARALGAAVSAQRDLAGQEWSHGRPLKVRMGIHTGEGVLGGDDYLGLDVNRAARIAAAGHGGQVLVSEATRGLVEQALPDGVELRDLGSHRLKDLANPERLYQATIAGLASEFPPLKSMDARANNLPLQLTSFVGRIEEIAQTAALLGEHRLVTLTGPGGTGKTRLALRVAAEVLPQFGDGVFFVDLAPITEPSHVPSAMAQALGLSEEPGREPIDTLLAHLSRKELLLVLDNFEQLLDAAPVAERLLTAAARLRILVTSRTPLRLYGEQEQPVPPLELPDLDDPPELDQLCRFEAVDLFIERARAARPGFELAGDTAPVVAEICARLDGLPLAIELAASRIKVLSPRAILDRLSSGLDLLAATARNLPPRQRTLRATIQWSYELLDKPERRLFARLSVFAGGFDLEAAETVVNPDRDLGLDTLEGLASLVDHSLIRQSVTPDGEPRFGMLVTIREYAAERLDASDDGPATRRSHAEYFLALAEAGEPHLTGRNQVEWLDRFEREHDNLLATFRWAIEGGDAELGLRAASSMWRFWQQRSHLTVGRRWLERLLSCPAAKRTLARARAELAAGSIAFWQRDYEATLGHYEEGLAISREHDDRPGIAEATFNLAFVPAIMDDKTFDHGFAGRPAHLIALARLDEAMGMFEDLGDVRGIYKTKGNKAIFLGGVGRLEEAFPLLEEAIAGYREIGETWYLADSLSALGQGHHMLGNLAEARAAFLEALGLVYRADNRAGIKLVLELLSHLESTRGHHQHAVMLSAKAEETQMSVEGGYPVPASEALPGFDFPADPRESMSEEAVNAALAEARSMTLAEAVAFAMEDD